MLTDKNMLTPEKFSIEGQEPFDGYYQPSDLWNGWARPYFPWETAVRIVEWTNRFSGNGTMGVDDSRKIIIDNEDPESPFEIVGKIMETTKGKQTLYAVGTGWWIWDIHPAE
ncbi:MAG: hypothetical protein EPO32_12825 [Anaerolineae bacterium]|nr:MAG: hypothetical protein EPO32_12825 [Anaerolineae bacterium]